MKCRLTEICRVLGLAAPAHDTDIDTLLTDSRSLTRAAGTLFFALTTGTGDGHHYLATLYREGVRAFVVKRKPDDAPEMPDAQWLVVADPLAALQTVASTLPPRPRQMIAITGSAGKTTLKEWLFQLLEPHREIIRSPRSWNSKIGVPLSLWQIDSTDAVAVIEAGISREGEMEALAQMIRPDLVILTGIGPAHSGGFADDAAKAREKCLLARGAKTVIYPADDAVLSAEASTIKGADLLTWSACGREATLQVSLNADGMDYVWRGHAKGHVALPPTRYAVENAAPALAYMLLGGYGEQEIADAFASLHAISTRLNVVQGVNGCTLIADAYTSDSASLPPVLDFARRRCAPGRRLTLVLSDLHHEVHDEQMYRRVARMVSESRVGRFIGIGPVLSEHRDLFAAIPEVRFYPTVEAMLSEMSTSDFSEETVLLKGSHTLPLEAVAELIEGKKHETVLEVNLDAIVKNYNYFRRHLPRQTGLIAMVKASGYGAGSYEIAKTMQAQGAGYLAVAVLDEGIDLRQAGITMPIMVMNPRVANYQAMFAHRLEPEIYSLDMLHEVIREARKTGITDYPIHIKLDTGMHRMGFIESELEELADVLLGQTEVRVETMFSHLATADCPDMDSYTRQQFERFSRYTEYMIGRLGRPIARHILNSAGILRFPEHHYEYARLGIGLYGANTLPPEMEEPLAVVSTLRTPIISIRRRKAGEAIGYSRRGLLTRDSDIATIPIGYADGMNRHFGCGRIKVYVGGKEAPTVGNICMDACMIDVTGIDCRVGDPVEIFGPNAPVQRLADVLDTIPYEILTSVSPRVKRIYYRE